MILSASQIDIPQLYRLEIGWYFTAFCFGLAGMIKM